MQRQFEKPCARRCSRRAMRRVLFVPRCLAMALSINELALHSIEPPKPPSLPDTCRTFAACEFQDLLFGLPPTQEAYDGLPLADVPDASRGAVLRAIVRADEARRLPDAVIADADGDFDWLRDECRVACRTAMLRWDGVHAAWEARWANVRLANGDSRPTAPFDDLLLALYTPAGVIVYRHDLCTGVARAGRQTETRGHTIRLAAHAGDANGGMEWGSSLERILDRLDSSSCECLTVIGLDDPLVQGAVAERPRELMAEAYRFAPLARLSPKARGRVLRQLCLVVDKQIFPGARIDEFSNNVFDYMRVDADVEERVTCRGAQLTWSGGRWWCQFTNVKLSAPSSDKANGFEHLLLALYTPCGVFMYKHDLRTGVTTNGKRTADNGHQIQVCGPSRQRDWRQALDIICEKLGEPYAYVSFPQTIAFQVGDMEVLAGPF